MGEQADSDDRLIYVIGVPSAGKTTLISAVSSHLRRTQPALKLLIVHEVARTVIAEDNVEREDIRSGKPNAMLMQKKILETQAAEEMKVESADLILLDRSGIDPIVFSRMYGGREQAQSLLESEAWGLLKCRMRRALVILCEPVPAWLVDDGVRLLPKDEHEWSTLHDTFRALLDQEDIRYLILPSSIITLAARVDFVMDGAASAWPNDE